MLDTIGHQLSISHLNPRPLLHYLGETEPTKYYIFIEGSIKIPCENIFCLHLCHFGW